MNEGSVYGAHGPAWAGQARGLWFVSELGQDSGAVCSAAEWTPPGDGVPPTTVSHLSRSSP